ncbi:hypothetical protein PUN28_006473 [Cardiocondyla obscurior]|uniref:Uncharacterized protein n=1 Tax=Cardiocondyla obscurior TaxID=286306 RepID=A0AAW2GCP6_9HYME
MLLLAAYCDAIGRPRSRSDRRNAAAKAGNGWVMAVTPTGIRDEGRKTAREPKGTRGGRETRPDKAREARTGREGKGAKGTKTKGGKVSS